MPKVQQQSHNNIMQKSQSQKNPYILTMPNISPGVHSYSVAEWSRRGPSLSLFDDDEAKLQYLTMIGGNWDGTWLLAQQGGWDDGDWQGGGIVVVKKEETMLESRHHREEGPASADRRVVRKKKISLAEYSSKKRVSSDGYCSAGEPEGARSIKGNETLLVADKTPERAPDHGISLLSASVESNKLSIGRGGNGIQEDKESSSKKRGQKRHIEAIIEPEGAPGKTRQEKSGSPPAKKIRASPKLNNTAQEATSSVRQGGTARGDKSLREPNGSDAVSVPIIKPPMTMVGAAAILPLPPTKDTRVRQSMRGVAAFTKPRVLSEPSARQPQVSTIPPAGAQQGYPSWVCRKHLEWVEKEVARRVAAALALALSKGENAPTTARARVPYKDAGTQVDAVIPIASASGGAEDDCFLIKKETVANKPRDNKPIIIKETDRELPSTATASEPELAVSYLFERKAAKKSAEQAMQQQQQQHVEEERPRINGRPLQLLKNQHQHRHRQLTSNNNNDDGRPQPPKNIQNKNPPADPKKPVSTKKAHQKNTSPDTSATEIRASAPAAASKAVIVNPPVKKNQAASRPKPSSSKNILRPPQVVPNWFQMLQPQPPSKKQS